MPFFAGRTNAINEPAPLIGNGADPQEARLPPFMESALQRVAASILPQLQPLVIQAEQTLKEFRDALAELKLNMAATRAELTDLRAGVEQLKAGQELQIIRRTNAGNGSGE